MKTEEIKGSAVFVVDDDPVNLNVIIDQIAEFEFDVVPIRSGEEALELHHKRKPDLILLDILMPEGIDGFDTCHRLRRMSRPGRFRSFS